MTTSYVAGRLPEGVEVVVTVAREEIQLSEGVYREIDPKWRWTDPAGHKHDASLALARWVVVRTYWCCDCCDEHEDSELQCVECAAVLEPRYVTRYEPARSIPGLMTAMAEVKRGPVRTTYVVTDSAALDILARGITPEFVAAVERTDRILAQTVEF